MQKKNTNAFFLGRRKSLVLVNLSDLFFISLRRTFWENTTKYVLFPFNPEKSLEMDVTKEPKINLTVFLLFKPNNGKCHSFTSTHRDKLRNREYCICIWQHSRAQFHQRFLCAFFWRKCFFCQNVTRKKLPKRRL